MIEQYEIYIKQNKTIERVHDKTVSLRECGGLESNINRSGTSDQKLE